MGIAPVSGDAPINTSPTNRQVTIQTVGTRGTLPVQVEGAYRTAGDGFGVQFWASGTTTTVTVPATYGDRQFVRWELNGQTVGTSPTLGFHGTDPAGNLHAVYTASPRPDSGLNPAYNHSDNPCWNHMPVRFYLDPTATQNPAVVPHLLAGIQRWEKATGGVVSFARVDNAANADVTVQFADVPTGAEAATHVDYDVTHTDGYPIGDLKSGIIKLRPGLLDNPADYILTYMEGVIAHEMGHALGITSMTAQGHSDDPLDTMYRAGNLQTEQITTRDVDTLLNLYAARLTGRAVRGTTSRATGGTVSRQQDIVCSFH